MFCRTVISRATQSNPNLVTTPVVGSASVTLTPELNPRSSKSMQHRRMRTQSHTYHAAGTDEPAGIMYRKDIFYQGSLLKIPQYKSNPDLYVTSITSIPHHYPQPPTKGPCKWFTCPDAMSDTMKEMMDITLLRDTVFILFSISNFLTSIGFNVPYVYLPDRASSLGFTKEEGAKLISIVGIANTIGRVILGYISDSKHVNRLFLYNTGLTLCGIASAISVLCRSFTSLSVYAGFFGISIGR